MDTEAGDAEQHVRAGAVHRYVSRVDRSLHPIGKRRGPGAVHEQLAEAVSRTNRSLDDGIAFGREHRVLQPKITISETDESPDALVRWVRYVDPRRHGETVVSVAMAVKRPAPVLVEHDPADLASIAADLEPGGWLNLLPEIPEDVPVPATPSALAVFSKRGPVVPLGTWTAEELGIQHGAAKRARDALAGTPGEIPADWTVVSDHPRRGVVVQPPPGTDRTAIARWLLDALAAICIPPQTGRFILYRYDAP